VEIHQKIRRRKKSKRPKNKKMPKRKKKSRIIVKHLWMPRLLLRLLSQRSNKNNKPVVKQIIRPISQLRSRQKKKREG